MKTRTIEAKPVAVCVTGASGVIYAVRLLEVLSERKIPVHLIVSDAGKIVLKEELNLSVKSLVSGRDVTLHGIGEIGASVASGSFVLGSVVICPCSSNTLGAVANGVGNNLICRVGAVALKEKWPLILIPRESPYSPPLLENMKLLSIYGAHILPASPSFYRKPSSIADLVDSVIDRVLVKMGLERLLSPWSGQVSK
ncbi:MAG: UbiX family flavin prenyltransferase [candidate division Zixibacteria bacterium]|nr:UbiX family flavin prenyltransferase [candidate division Zixibacteria bacterium]